MKTMCYHPGYYGNRFDNIYQALIKTKHNRQMVCKVCSNMK